MQAARGASLNASEPADQPTPTESAAESQGGLAQRRLALTLVVAVLAWLLDFGSKTLVVARLSGHPPVHVLGNLLELSLVRNAGAAFSTGTSHTAVISGVAVAAMVVTLFFSYRVRSRGWAVALGLLLAGIAGNLTDRIFRSPGVWRGHVVDFMRFPHWPIFNVADVCINVAVVLIVILSLRGTRLDGRRPPS